MLGARAEGRNAMIADFVLTVLVWLSESGVVWINLLTE